VAYRTFVVAGVRDPMLVACITEVEAEGERIVRGQYGDISPNEYRINFVNYGLNGVLGEIERQKVTPFEIGVMFEVIASTQEVADAICSSVRSTFLHYGYEGRKSTAGNLAFPFSPSDVSFGPVYEFSVYHLMEVADGHQMF